MSAAQLIRSPKAYQSSFSMKWRTSGLVPVQAKPPVTGPFRKYFWPTSMRPPLATQGYRMLLALATIHQYSEFKAV